MPLECLDQWKKHHIIYKDFMIGDTMKSGVVDTDRGKVDLRQPHRRKMAKSLHVLNGGGDLAQMSMMRQVNLAAAYHDHISCTKSADLCNKISDAKESRANLPCETDHIYANCSENKPSSKMHNMVAVSPSKDERRQLYDMCLLQLDLIKHLEEQNASKEKQIQILRQENEVLKLRQERVKRRLYLSKKSVRSDESDNQSEVGSIASDSPIPLVAKSLTTENLSPTKPATVHLATRYFGRRSKTIPLRALKRRYVGPPKPFPCNKKAKHSSASTSSISEIQEEEEQAESAATESAVEPSTTMTSCEENFTKVHKKREKKRKVVPRQEDYLTTDKEYYLPDYYSTGDVLANTETIDVPSWRYRPITSFYQMEGTENLDDRVFQRRHLKCEQDEKRRKRWDMQRLREQKATQKLKHKKGGSLQTEESEDLSSKMESLYPDPMNIQFIEVTDRLPVQAFGRPIPLFQPSEFSLTWKIYEKEEENEAKKKFN